MWRCKKSMLLATTRCKSIFLLDFLAPSLLTKAAHITTSKYSKPSHSPPRTAEPTQPRKTLLSFHNLEPAQIQVLDKRQEQLRSAYAKNDASTVIATLRDLDQHKLFHVHISPAQVKDGLQFLLQEASAGKLNSSDESWLSRLAVEAASSTPPYFDALSTLMLHRLRQKNFTAVIDLYDKFIKRSSVEELRIDTEANGEHNVQGIRLVSDEHHRQNRVNPERVYILLTAIAAHASQGTFQSALQLCLKDRIPFHSYTVQSFLEENVLHDEAFHAKFKRFTAHLEIARMLSQPASLSKHIAYLSGAKSTKPLEGFYQSVMDGISGTEPYITLDSAKKSSEKPVTLTEIGWAAFLSAFLRYRRRDLASKIWADQLALGITPGALSWTTLIDSYGSMNEVEQAAASWKMMTAQGIQPETLTYRALISALFKGRKRDQALKVFQVFQRQPPHSTTEAHLLSLYNTVLDGLLSFNEEAAVQDLLEKMEKQGPKPDVVSFNTLLAYHTRRGNFQGLSNVVGRMTGLGIAGDVYTFSTILSALLKAGRRDAPDLLMEIMRKQGVQPNVAIYTTIISHQLQNLTEDSLEIVMQLLQSMEQDRATKPNAITYTSILTGLYHIDWKDSRRRDQWWKEIIGRMKKLHVDFTEPSYHFIITTCLNHPEPEGLERALTYYRQMRRRNMTNHNTWYLLLSGLLSRGEWEVAEEIVKDMVASGHQPSDRVKRLMFKISRRAAS